MVAHVRECRNCCDQFWGDLFDDLCEGCDEAEEYDHYASERDRERFEEERLWPGEASEW